MKRLILPAFLCLISVGLSFADESKSNSPSKDIELIINTRGQSRPIKRVPIYIDIEASYNTYTQAIEISYSGESDGEVYLYKDAEVIDHSTEINTSFSVTIPGSYKIEIQTESWTAEGYLEL